MLIRPLLIRWDCILWDYTSLHSIGTVMGFINHTLMLSYLLYFVGCMFNPDCKNFNQTSNMVYSNARIRLKKRDLLKSTHPNALLENIKTNIKFPADQLKFHTEQ